MAILKNKKLLYNSTTLDVQKIYKLIKDQTNFQIYENDDDDTVSATYILKEKNFIIIVYKKNIDNKIENFEDTLLFLDPILLLLLLFAASKLIDKILFPIKKLTETTKDISVNNFSSTIELPKKEDEIKELVNSFNTMIIRLKEGVENLDRFNNDVSHELKTPLTVIQGEIEITLRKLREPKEYQKSMQVIYYEAKQMQSIVENLLLLTKYSQQNIQHSFEECPLDSMLLEVLDKFSKQIEEKKLNIELKKLETVSSKVNKTLFYSIFSNLIDNAIKYTSKGKNIYIALYAKDEHVYFEIQDEGIGIDKSQLSKITDRFYRVDESRNKDIKGFGLGLSIVKNSINLHGGTLIINSKLNKGTNILVKISFN
jgi:signal transduction histidine kinase